MGVCGNIWYGCEVYGCEVYGSQFASSVKKKSVCSRLVFFPVGKAHGE